MENIDKDELKEIVKETVKENVIDFYADITQDYYVSKLESDLEKAKIELAGIYFCVFLVCLVLLYASIR